MRPVVWSRPETRPVVLYTADSHDQGGDLASGNFWKRNRLNAHVACYE